VSRARVRGGYALVAVAASSWGTWPLILRRAEAIAPLDPALESFILMAVLTIVGAPLCVVDRVRRRATWREWAAVGWLGVGDAGNVLLFFAAYQKTTVAVAVLTHYLTPILVAIAAPVVLKEHLGRRALGAAAAAFVGLVILLEPWRGSASAQGMAGALLGAGSAVFYASNVIVNKRLIGAFSGAELTFWHGVLATALLALAVPRAAWIADPHATLVVAAGSVGPGALAGLFFVWGLRRVPASHASTLTLLEPLVAVASASVVYGERLGVAGGLGAALILLSAAFVVRAGMKP
jgi:drug/metabolite transporter (DMT)-like permease